MPQTKPHSQSAPGHLASPVWQLNTQAPWRDQVSGLVGLLSTDVLIVGAGLPGLAAARTAAMGGHSVLVIDAAEIGGSATLGSAGVIDPSDTPATSADPVERLAALSAETLAARGAAMLSALVAPPATAGAINIADAIDALARDILAHGGKLANNTRAIGFGQIGTDTWVVSTDRARVSAKAVVIATGAMVGAPRSFSGQIRAGFSTDVRWTLASAPGAGLPLTAACAGHVMRQTVAGVERTLHIDDAGRLIVGGLVGSTESEARAVIGRWIGTKLGGVPVPPLVSVSASVVAAPNDQAAQLHRLGYRGYALIAPEQDGLTVGCAMGQSAAEAIIAELRGHAAELPLPLYMPPPRRRAFQFGGRRFSLFGASI
ncbi:MAG: putative oxidoreductase OrdL [Pseudomonadota bacterium]|jgi:flavin-dependent dehydrogenase